MASADMEEGSESEQEEYDYAMDIFRTDGYWYNNAYEVLPKFACNLKMTEIEKLPLPIELCQLIGQYTWANDVRGIERLKIAREASEYILATLQEKMAALPNCVHSADPYMNVINYFRAREGDEFIKGLMKAEDKYLLENVLPWLGLTDWGSNSGSKGGKYGGRTRQMENFKYKLRRFLPSKQPAALPASAASAASSVPLSLDELRSARMTYIQNQRAKQADTSNKGIHKGGKRLHTRKLRRKRKSSKRSCKRR